MTDPNPDWDRDADASTARTDAAKRIFAAESMRFAGAGLELGGASIVMAAIGYAIDRTLGNTTLIATALGAIVGFAAGLYRFIRMAMKASLQDRLRQRDETTDQPD